MANNKLPWEAYPPQYIMALKKGSIEPISLDYYHGDSPATNA